MVVDNKAKLSYIQIIKEDLGIFHITPNDGPIPDFKAGQFVTLGFHIPSEGKIVRRAYSIASPPEQKKRFRAGHTLGTQAGTWQAHNGARSTKRKATKYYGSNLQAFSQ